MFIHYLYYAFIAIFLLLFLLARSLLLCYVVFILFLKLGLPLAQTPQTLAGHYPRPLAYPNCQPHFLLRPISLNRPSPKAQFLTLTQT